MRLILQGSLLPSVCKYITKKQAVGEKSQTCGKEGCPSQGGGGEQVEDRASGSLLPGGPRGQRGPGVHQGHTTCLSAAGPRVPWFTLFTSIQSVQKAVSRNRQGKQVLSTHPWGFKDE